MIPQSDYQFLRDAGVQGIYGPGSNVVECAADMLRLLGHNMPPPDDEMDEEAEELRRAKECEGVHIDAWDWDQLRGVRRAALTEGVCVQSLSLAPRTPRRGVNVN